MVVKITNEHPKFYQYMGKFFGSRTIERKINERIYDYNGKVWYICIEDGKVMSFVSVSKNIIKNIYAVKEQYLEEILKKIKKENIITYSIVPKCYKNLYQESGFEVSKNQDYKNFVIIYMETGITPLID